MAPQRLATMVTLSCVLALTVAFEQPHKTCIFLANRDLHCSTHASECTDIGNLTTPNASACCTTCMGFPGCNTAVFETWSSLCFIKAMSVGSTLSQSRAGVVGCITTLSPSPSPSSSRTPPHPPFPFRNMSLPLNERVKDLVGRLTLDEKILQMTRGGAASNCPAPAITRLGIAPHVWGTECNTGLGSDDATFAGTSFPQPLGQAAMWDRDISNAIATATHVELRAQHNDDMRNGVVAYHHGINCWSPVINIMRHWAWGRNDETYGECPVLSSALAKAFVQGLQGSDPNYVAASAGCKHFVVHGGPDATRHTFDANVSLRDWATTFLPAFETCVMSGGLGMMCSFNSIRGVPACANHRSMTTWARTQWNFTGYIVSDQGAAYGIMADHKYANTLAEAAAYSINAGLDLEDANNEQQTAFSGISQAISQKLLTEAAVDTAVSRLFLVRFRLGEFDDDKNLNPYLNISTNAIRSQAHLNLTRVAATKSLVLLKNENDLLPLSRSAAPRKTSRYSRLHAQTSKTIAVVGPFADCQACYFGKYSPHMDVNKTTSVSDGLTKLGQTVIVASGCTDGSEPYECAHYNKSAVIAAVATSNTDVVVIAVGLGSGVESEGKDRTSLDLPGMQNQLVLDAVSAAKEKDLPIIALLFVAGPVEPSLFDDVDAIIDCVYPGEATGLAVADILLGIASPAGRLPFSWPTKATDVAPEVDYTMVGRTYRYAQQNVKWPFGHGLSYTSFRYSDMKQSTTSIETNACTTVTINVSVTNTGDTGSDEVVQGYLQWHDVKPMVETPSLSLFDFKRIYVKPGETVTVALVLTPRDMAVLSQPQCGIISQSLDTSLIGTPFKTIPNATVDSCCGYCSEIERCEAYTYKTDTRDCEIFSAWALTEETKGSVSGEPLSQWMITSTSITLSVGGSSANTSVSSTLIVSGQPHALTQCQQ